MKITLERIVLILSLLLIISSTLLSEDNILKNLNFERQILLPSEVNDLRKIKLKYFGNNLYFICHQAKEYLQGDTIYLYEYENNVFNKFKIYLPITDWIHDFFVDGQKFYLTTQTSILVYTKKGQNLEFINRILLPNDQIYRHFVVNSSNLYLWESCYSCDHPGNNFIIFDSLGNKIKKDSFEIPKAFQLSFYAPSNYLDYHDNLFLVSDIIQYKINIFDAEKNKVSIINRDIMAFRENINYLKLFDSQPYNVWAKQKKFKDSLHLINRIELANFYNDSIIFICYSDNRTKNDLEFKYDIWILENGEYKLYKQDLKFINLKKDDKFEPNLAPGSLFNNYVVSNGKIIVKSTIPLNVNSEKYNNFIFSDFWKEVKNFNLNNELQMSLFIYTIK